MFSTLRVYVTPRNMGKTAPGPPWHQTHRRSSPSYHVAVTQSFLCNRGLPTRRFNQPWIHRWLNSWAGNSQIQRLFFLYFIYLHLFTLGSAGSLLLCLGRPSLLLLVVASLHAERGLERSYSRSLNTGFSRYCTQPREHGLGSEAQA